MENTIEKVMSNDVRAKKVIPVLLILFVLTNLMVQTFVTVSPIVATHFGLSASAVSVMVTITTITVGVCSVIYGALSDFVSIKKILVAGLLMLALGSVIGYAFQNFFVMIVIARAIQTAGQAAVSAMYLVIASRYLKGAAKIRYLAYFTACYQLAQALGVAIGGKLTEFIPWQGLLLIPLISCLFLPIVIKFTPDEVIGEKKKMDFAGLAIFAAFIVFITLFLSDLKVSLLFLALASLALFIVYIYKNEDAFITPKFFKQNKAYVRALCLVLVTYFIQYAFPFIYTFIITNGYEQPLSAVSLILFPGYIAATAMGGISDKVTMKLGKFRTILLGMSMILTALVGTIIFIEAGTLVLIICGVLFFSGFNIVYSPIIDSVTGALPEGEVGRGIGLNDLSLNISASIGVAIAGKIVSSTNLPKIAFVPQNAALIPFQYAIFFLAIFSVIAIIFLVKNRKQLFN